MLPPVTPSRSTRDYRTARWRPAAALLAWLVLVAPVSDAVAQPVPRTELSEQIELARLVDLASQRLGVNIEYDRSRLTGQVTLRLGAGVTDDELWSLTNRLLLARGFTTVRIAGDDTLSVVPIASAASLARVEPVERVREEISAASRGEAPPPGAAHPPAGFRAALVHLRHRPAKEATEAIKPLLSSPGGSVTPLGDAAMLVIADSAPRLAEALGVLEGLDSPGAAATVEEVALLHLDAPRLISLAGQVESKRAQAGGVPMRGQLVAGTDGRSVLLIASERERAAWLELITRLDRREPVETVTYAPRAFTVDEVAASIERLVREVAPVADDRFRIVPDALTGTLLVTATPSQHARVEELLERLESTPEAVRRPSRTFVLRNRDVSEALGVVQSLIAAGALDAAAAPAVLEPGSEPGARVQPAEGPSLSLTADPATNSLIVFGEPRELERLEALLRDLDVRRPQVLLEVLIVSISESDSLTLGVELERLIDGPGDTVARLSSLFGLSGAGASGSLDGAGRGAGFTGIVLNPGDFSVVVRALQAINRGRSLSMPRVLVAGNEQATINSVLEQPFISTNASNTVATTSFGGSQSAGTTVSVRPQIAEGDHLRLDYQVSLSAFVGEAAAPQVPPPRQQNSVRSVATIPDGYTIAVGGIELLTDAAAESRVPLIGEIPIIGEAFKNRSKSNSRSRFYVFIRPTILRTRDFEGLKHLSDLASADAGVDDGWPVPQPRVIR